MSSQSFISIICSFVLIANNPRAQDVATLIQDFGFELESLSCDDLRVGGSKCSNGLYGIQDFIYSFEDDFENDMTTDASDLAQSIIARLNTTLYERAEFLSTLSSTIRTECAYYGDNDESESLVPFDDLYFSGNGDTSANLPDDMEYSTVHANTISLSSSTYKLPTGVDTDAHIQKDARISQLLDDTMITLYNDYCAQTDGDDDFCSMYFGTVNGLFRQFPGVESSSSGSEYSSYDPRFRPWYVSAATGSKDVVILVDVSGSMRQSNRMTLAKEAITSVLSTLGSSSFVNVVAFNDAATLSCFGTDLVAATSSNVAELIDFVDNLEPTGLTDFVVAFNAAFDILQYAQNCQTSIIFLTDGKADDPSYVITERNTEDIGAVIFSYTLGGSAETAVPEAVAEMTNGIYTHIDDNDDNLITTMSSYYLYYAYGGVSGSDNDNIIVTSPYLDFDTEVIMITMALPVYIDDTHFVGVVGTDIPLTFLTDAIGDITIGRESYSFVMNEEAELILHPLIPSADQLIDTNSDYRSIFVDDVEPIEFTDSVLPNMLAREDGMMRIEASVKQPAGNVVYNGYIYVDAVLLYIYSAVGPSSLSIAIVIYSEAAIEPPNVASFGMVTSPSDDCNSDIDYVVNQTDLEACLAPFNLFHRIDLMTECNSSWLQTAGILNGSDAENVNKPGNAFYEGKLYTPDYPIYFIQSGLFEEQQNALNVDPSCDALDALHTLTNRGGSFNVDNLPFGGLREEISQNILNSIYTLTSVHEFWKPSFLADDSLFVSMYFGHYQGLHISYPGKQFSNTYNNQIRPWYQRAISYPDLMVWTTPYKHAVTKKLVTGASTVIYAPFSDYAFGVVGFDFEYTTFVDYWKLAMGAVCDNTNGEYCYLIDSSAFCLYYEKMEDYIDDDDISRKFFGDFEPTLMQSLLDRGLFMNDTNVNFQDDTIDITYIADTGVYVEGNFDSQSTSFSYNDGAYTVHSVAKTNLYVIYIEGYSRSNTYPSNCPNSVVCTGVTSPGCLTTSNSCVSATVDVCTEADTTLSVDDDTSVCDTSDISLCSLENEEGDMCASNFIDDECDEYEDEDDGVNKYAIHLTSIMMFLLCFITN